MNRRRDHGPLDEAPPPSTSSPSPSPTPSPQDQLPTTEKGATHSTHTRDWRRWLEEEWTWAVFTCTQSTGGIALSLSECPKQFNGLQTIGTVIFIFNIILFLLFTGLMLLRWYVRPATRRRCFTAAPECFFFGSFWLSIATIIMGIQRFGVPHAGPWLVDTVRVLFWMYAAIVFLSSTTQFSIVFKYTPIEAINMTPAWLLMVFCSMLTGTVAAVIAPDQPPHHRLPIIVAGTSYQGFGWVAATLVLGWFLGHLMQKGWPPPSMAPSLFMPIGAVGYTIVALIGSARAIPQGYGYFATHPTAQEILLVVATWSSIFLWLFGTWLLGLALFVTLGQIASTIRHRTQAPMSFNNTWWAMIFPNIGFALSTVYLGQELESNAIQWFSVAVIIIVIVVWLLDLVLMAKSVAKALLKGKENA